MKLLPRSLVILILYLAVFFNLEHIGLSENSAIHIHRFAYFYATVAVASILYIPKLRRQSFFALLMIFTLPYLAIKFLFLYPGSGFELTFLYLSFTELVLLAIAILLAYNTALKLEDFVDVVENITFAGLRKVVSIREASEEIENEIYRSRRYKHPLTVIVTEPQMETLNIAIHKTVKDVQASMMERYVLVSLMTRALNNQLRKSDSLLDLFDKRKFVIILPETEQDRSSVIINRIAEAAHELGVSVSCGKATFPTDALNFESLLKEAEAHSSLCICLDDKDTSGINEKRIQGINPADEEKIIG